MEHKRLGYFIKTCLFSCLFLLTLSRCSTEPEGSAGGVSRLTESEQAFVSAGQKYKIPSNLLMSIAYLESKMSPLISYSLQGDRRLGAGLTESAFGIPLAKLGLDPDDESSQALAVQTDAYSKWIAERVSDLSLSSQPNSADEIFS